MWKILNRGKSWISAKFPRVIMDVGSEGLRSVPRVLCLCMCTLVVHRSSPQLSVIFHCRKCGKLREVEVEIIVGNWHEPHTHYVSGWAASESGSNPFYCPGIIMISM